MTTTGITSAGSAWRLFQDRRNYVFELTTADGEVARQKINATDAKKFAAYEETFSKLIEVADPLLLSDTVPLSKFAGLRSLTRDHFNSVAKLESAWLQLSALCLYLAKPSTDETTAFRVARTQAGIEGGLSALDSYFLDLHVAAQKTSLGEWLDVWDFLINGEARQTYSHFNAKHAGRAFPVPYVQVTTQYRTVVKYRSDHLSIDKAAVSNIAHRFLQLSRRSQKLKKKLHTMPLEKIIQALDFNIAGTLLVSDTIELIDSLKHVRLRSDRAFYSTELDSRIGLTLANRARKLKIDGEISKYFGYKYEQLIIRDLYGVWSHYAALAPFITHAARKLGLAETLRILQLIETETDGITMRGWMELVRRGGFPPDQPASWTAIMLADK